MIKCCIFDLDGTLVNSLNDIANATNFALMTLGLPAFETEKYRHFVGSGIKKLIERVLPENCCNSYYKQKMLELFNEKYNECCIQLTKPYPEIPETLAELKSHNIVLAIVTNKPDAMAKKIVSSLLPDIFSNIYGNTANIPVKPAPDLCFKILQNHGIGAQDCFFVGDSDVDMQTALNAKMLPVGVTWGFRSRNELKLAGAKHIINSPNELLGFL